ncbi:hypothetical protein GLOTRDRAFT_66839 [Gloeophyllum trabeum ATCC 11539]|uniref:BTB domain-containing protein n=1 Tax=Gloeophyllum trabeum (strain ATCC 11539 / FP-39264 / Madison 617) TaxID=670483 RepID=S7RE36_GLOTA|nr:uncharacterized protein GLOTRDRAFT_66839 [Gloeophyllum trabeum ATCC 11539]EPQ50724.1 hypothetical protein GLOTRDRAFT_66839 [Gloeophyllum trabeum ATCC 11539]
MRQETGFLVHRSMLCKVSPIFADMFTLPPSNVNESFEGLPVVQMPDAAEALEMFLKILYQEAALPVKRLDPNTPALVGPLLGLATKYEVEHLRTQVVARLMEDWPTSLPAWDTLEAEITAMREGWHSRHNCTGPTCDEPLDHHLPEPVAAIQLAKQYKIPAILPSAFYHLSRLSIEWGPDGTETYPSIQRGRLFMGTRTARWKSLPGNDYYNLLAGRTRLQNAAQRHVRGWKFEHVELPGDILAEAGVSDHEDEGCSRNARRNMISDLEKAIASHPDVLRTLQTYASFPLHNEPKDVCPRCVFIVMEKASALRKYLWEHLPEFFNIDTI